MARFTAGAAGLIASVAQQFEAIRVRARSYGRKVMRDDSGTREVQGLAIVNHCIVRAGREDQSAGTKI